MIFVIMNELSVQFGVLVQQNITNVPPQNNYTLI